MELTTDRPTSMGGIPPIPFTSICKYAEAYDFRGEDFDDLKDFVRVLDNTFLDFRRTQKDSEPSKGKGKKSSKEGMVKF